ncbi:hypothetical protein A2899_01850 [Candidatus Amesbacteria bacterium RIFCSPLOWO2_01_FULL_49_25]|nr:MAG: hypothetical protein A2899_01850 [Candidatus Amesbacteria bacterium RIFCSPLOWO2_01_FULL_49_25]
MRVKAGIFVGVFFLTVFFLGVRWRAFGLMDDIMWADQTEYIQKNDARQYDARNAYGHPGTTITTGTFVVSRLTKLPYRSSLYVFLTVFCGILIAVAATICYGLAPGDVWWLTTGFVLSLDKAYEYATPPSVAAALLVVLVVLLTLVVLKRGESGRLGSLFFWGVGWGTLLATRFDIGAATGVFFLPLVLWQTGWRKTLSVVAVAIFLFLLADPFMWSNPIGHVRDLIGKAGYHYLEYPARRLSWVEVSTFSSQAFVSMVFAGLFVVLGKRLAKPFPSKFLVCLLIFTVGLYAVFLTANYQAARYFLPLTLTWQVLLPAFLFSLISKPRIKIYAAGLFIGISIMTYGVYFWRWRGLLS